MAVATRTVFFQLKPPGRILFIFSGSVITLLALGAGNRNDLILFLRTHCGTHLSVD